MTLAVSGAHVWAKSGYITLAVSGIPNAQHRKEIRIGYLSPAISEPTCGQKGHIPLLSRGSQQPVQGEIRSGYITLSGAQMWAKWLHTPYHLRSPQQPAQGEIRSSWPQGGMQRWLVLGDSCSRTKASVFAAAKLANWPQRQRKRVNMEKWL